MSGTIFYFDKSENVIGIGSFAEAFHNRQKQELAGLITHTIETKFTASSRICSYFGMVDIDDSSIFWMYKVTDRKTTNRGTIELRGIYKLFDDLKHRGYIQDRRPENTTIDIPLLYVLDSTGWSIGHNTVTAQTSSHFYYENKLDAFWKILQAYRCEFRPRIIFDKGRIKQQLIDLAPKFAEDNGRIYSFGDRLLTVEEEIVEDEIITAITPLGKGEQISNAEDNESGQAGYGRRIRIDEIVWSTADGDLADKPFGQEYIENKKATEEYGFADGTPRIAILTYPDIEDKEELIRVAWEDLQALSRPKAQLKADVLETRKASIGEYIGVIRDDIGIRYKTRIFSLDRNFNNSTDKKIQFGEQIKYDRISSEIKIRKEYKNAIDEIWQLSNQAVLSADGKTTVFYGSDINTPPIANNVGDQWFVTYTHPDTGKEESQSRIWTGAEWKVVSDTGRLGDVEFAVQQTDQKAQQAFTEAEKATQEATKAITGLSTKADLTDLQKTETDILAIQGRLDPTIPDSLAYQVASHTSTIAEQGGRLETLRGDLDNLEPTKRNLLQSAWFPQTMTTKESVISGRNYPITEANQIKPSLKPNTTYTFQYSAEIVSEGSSALNTICGFQLYVGTPSSDKVSLYITTEELPVGYVGKVTKAFTFTTPSTVPEWILRANTRLFAREGGGFEDGTIRFTDIILVEGEYSELDWSPAPEDLLAISIDLEDLLVISTEFNDYKQTSEGYFQRIQAVELDLKSGVTYTKINDIKNTAEESKQTLAVITDGDVTAYNQKISTALSNISTIQQDLDPSVDGSTGFRLNKTEETAGRIEQSLTQYAKTTDLNGLATETYATNVAIEEAGKVQSILAQITDGDVTAYNQKISTALGDIQTIMSADYATQISNVAGRINVQIVDNADGSKSMMDMTSNQLLYNIDGGKIQVTQDKFYMDQTLIVPIIQTTKLSATQIESGTLDASKANIINLNAANIVGQNANLVRGSFNAINTSINIDGNALTTKGNWGGDIKLSNRGLTVYDNLANREMGALYGLFRNDDDPYKDQLMLATGLFAGYGYKLNLGLRSETTNENYSIISLDTSEEHGVYQMNVFGDILARYDLKMFGGMLTGAANAGYTVTEANGGHCIELANGWKIQFWRSSYQTFTSGWTSWTFPKRFTSIPRIVLAQAIRDDENLTLCNAYSLNYQACNIRIQDKTLSWTIVAIAIGR